MSYQSLVLANSPIGYWRLGEASGASAADISGNGLTGAYNSCTLGVPGLVGGDADTAVSFNGTSSYVALGTPTQLRITGVISLEAIVSVAGFPPNGNLGRVMGRGPDSSLNEAYYFRFYTDSGGVHHLLCGSYTNPNATADGVDVTVAWPTNEKHHIVGRYDGTAWKIFIDGTQAGSFTDATGAILGVGTPGVYVGANANGIEHFSGVIDEVAIYNTSLSTTDISAHAAAAMSSPVTLSAATVPTTGNQINLTLTGTATTLDSTLFTVSASGRVIDVGAATGSGTSWVLPITLRSGWIESGATVVVTYYGGTGANASVSATNSSTRTAAQKLFVTDKAFGHFVHLSSSTFGYADPLTLTQVQAIDFPSYNPDQWFTSVLTQSGARYAVLTTKHAGGFSLWPTQAGNWNISQTAFGVAHPGADIVKDWVGMCRKYNIIPCLYINLYDPWFLYNSPGHDGSYHNPQYTSYMSQQITELFSNYGQIGMLWVDGYFSIGAFPFTTLQSLRNSLNPSCVLISNTHAGGLAGSDIAEYEGSGAPGPAPPTSGNSEPSEFSEDSRTNNLWVWTGVPSDDVYQDIWTVVNKMMTLRAARTAYLLNFPVTTGGIMPASAGTFAAQIGAYMGKRGGAVLPRVLDVTSQIDRGDQTLGVRGSGINGSSILGLA
jgi:hypothetical protein